MPARTAKPRAPKASPPSPVLVRDVVDAMPKSLNTTDSAPAKPRRFLRLAAVMDRTGLPRPTLYRKMEQGKFPKTVNLDGRSVAWREADIDKWMDERDAAPPMKGPYFGRRAPASAQVTVADTEATVI